MKSDFVEYEEVEHPKMLNTANGGQSAIKGWGTVLLSCLDGQGHVHAVRVGPVGHVPGLTDRLLSLGQFLHQDMSVRGDTKRILLLKDDMVYLRFTPDPVRMNYYVLPIVSNSANSIQYELVYAVDYQTLHRRLGHVSRDVMRQMRKGTVGFPGNVQIPDENPVCDGCARGKMPRREFPAIEERASAAFDVIHSDLKEFPTLSYAKYKYAIVFVDDHTSFAWVTLLKKKSDALAAAKDFLSMVENEYETTVKAWRSDQGGELIGNLNLGANKFLQMLKSKGIKILSGAPHAHQQNGRAERFIRTMTEKGEALHFQASIPPSW